jgi:hypothetical protein
MRPAPSLVPLVIKQYLRTSTRHAFSLDDSRIEALYRKPTVLLFAKVATPVPATRTIKYD